MGSLAGAEGHGSVADGEARNRRTDGGDDAGAFVAELEVFDDAYAGGDVAWVKGLVFAVNRGQGGIGVSVRGLGTHES